MTYDYLNLHRKGLLNNSKLGKRKTNSTLEQINWYNNFCKNIWDARIIEGKKIFLQNVNTVNVIFQIRFT